MVLFFSLSSIYISKLILKRKREGDRRGSGEKEGGGGERRGGGEVKAAFS